MSGEVQPAPKRPSLLLIVYGQIAAMFGAFSLLVFLTHFFDLGLKGVIREAFDGWVQSVRPVIGYPLEWVASLLPSYMRFAVPDVAKDYLGVGIVYALSEIRARMALGHLHPWNIPSKYRPPWISNILRSIFLWPLDMLLFVTEVLSSFASDEGTELDRLRRSLTTRLFVLTIAPLVYLGLLFATNAWLV